LRTGEVAGFKTFDSRLERIYLKSFILNSGKTQQLRLFAVTSSYFLFPLIITIPTVESLFKMNISELLSEL
jgi:hypothetical protein